MLACVALLFASCNQAVDDGNYVKLNDGNPVTAAMAIDAITNQRGGSIFVKLSDACQQGELEGVIAAIKANSSVMVELDLSDTWHDADEVSSAAGAPDIFGGVVDVNGTDVGGRKITTFGDIAGTESPDITFAGIKNLKSISLPFTVQTIGKSAFEGCENLEEVTINFFFTSDVDRTNLYATEYMYDDKFLLNTIDDFAFRGCKNLRTFILVSDPDNDDVDEGFPVSLSTIGAEAFKDCYSLQGVRFFNTRNMGVGYQHEVEGVDFVAHLDDLKGPNATATLYYEDDFGGRNVLSEYSSGINSANGVTGDADQQPLEIGDGAFENCTSLEYVDFTGKLQVKGMAGADTTAQDDTISDRAFNGCERLATIFFPTVLVEKASLSPASPVDIYAAYEVGTGTNGQAARGSLDGSVIAKCAFGNTPGKVIARYGDMSFQYTAITSDMIHDLFHFTDFGEPSAADVGTDGTTNKPYHGSKAEAGADADYVDYIGMRAFFGCANIETVELPSTITADMSKLGDGAFANTGVQYIWVHANDNVYSIVEDWLGADNGAVPATYTKPAPYWRGALVDADPADRTTMPETIYAWFVTPYSGDLTYLPLADSQNPNTKVLGDALKSIKGDAFYKNVDVEKILFPAALVDPAEDGIGDYAFCKTENLQAVAVDADIAGWNGANQGMGAFSWNPVTSIMTTEGASGRINK